ncbi:DoxX protein [Caulobacter sp. AP07]|uniref:DoxX family membrane protein n=1 Tax=Caulobacter sp. AP07 TaxID=1144304 RepID=UPI000271ED6A|nr:DoxX family protein [Caulobacter sp. AP07]EJL35824.1 DoxX protein [Caulobacter sp. AP07]
MHRDGVLYGLGAIALGVIGLVFGDFALQWQPVPKDLPGHAILAALSAAALLLLGAGVLWRRTARIASAVLAAIYAVWVVLLHGPLIIAQPTSVAAWLGVAEILALAMGGLALFAMLAPSPDAKLRLTARLLFGACALVFGLSHFAYAAFTATMVPAWIPFPLFWAYATGCGHLAAGLALVSGVLSRLAATLLAAMMGTFVLLLHLPRVLAAPGSQLEWTMLAIALSLTGAAWALSRTLPTGERSNALTLNLVRRDA